MGNLLGCVEMPFATFDKAITSVYDAVLDEEHRRSALQAVAECVGAADVVYLVLNKKTGEALSLDWWGPFSGNSDDYMAHYAKIDPLRAAQESAVSGRWVRATEILPPSLLSRDEWYNDFILARGMRDIINGKLYENASYTVLMGFQCAIGDGDQSPRDPAALEMLAGALCKAARLHIELRETGYRSAISQEALDCLAAGVLIVDREGRVLTVNPSAERILSLGDGLTVRYGKLCARRNFETGKLAGLIAAAASALTPASGYMLIARAGGGMPYVLGVAPVGVALSAFDWPVAMVLIAAPVENYSSEVELADLFGLSPAESRLAAALARGKKPPEIAEEFGVQISTVRTQLSAILKKLNVERQSDIVRLVSIIPICTRSEMASPAKDDKG
jgi:DNA-binding CsgD family transcriptional regulator/PAS domain-containing protein